MLAEPLRVSMPHGPASLGIHFNGCTSYPIVANDVADSSLLLPAAAQVAELALRLISGLPDVSDGEPESGFRLGPAARRQESAAMAVEFSRKRSPHRPVAADANVH